jgi:hypothetical protein
VVINAGASSNQDKLVKISVGDLVAAEGEIEENCIRKIDGGIFVVNSVQHTLDKRRGWLITLEVAALPGETISSSSHLYSPGLDEEWDSIDDYKAETNAT